MLTDIEIASQASMLPITEVAAGLGVCADELEPYGRTRPNSPRRSSPAWQMSPTAS